MRNKIKKVAYVVSSSAILGALSVVAVHAAGLDVPQQDAMAKAGFYTLLQYVLNFILAVLGVLGIVGIAVSGVLYITSGGDEKRTEMAKQWMLYSIMGLVIALLGYTIVKSIANLLGGTDAAKF